MTSAKPIGSKSLSKIGPLRSSSKRSVPLEDYITTNLCEIHGSNGDQVSKGQSGLELMHAVWASETAVNRMIPEFTPRPLCVGIYNSDSETHFFLAEFIDMVQDVVPPPDKYMAPVVALHSRTMGKSPTGKFGFHTGTAYGDILQNNTWESSWESFWTRVMREAFETEERMCGPHDERLKALKAAWFDCVLPRYLRPLESEGRSVTPCLVHADLWPGNCRYTSNMETVCVYDANAFWGHNEGMYHVSAPRHAFLELEFQLIGNFQLI